MRTSSIRLRLPGGFAGWVRLASLVVLAPVLLVGAVVTAEAQRPTTEALDEDLAELTPYSPNGATVKRNPKGNLCVMSQPFEFLACGPATTISLALMPGMYGSLDHTTTQGGQAAQIMDQLLGAGQVTGPNTLEELARQADAVDGSSITITIPLIDYGYTGTFRNAAISMNRANRDSHYSIYEAVGPRDALPGAEKGFPLSGQVTILEYTPWVLRGTFSAAMVDKAQSDMTVDDPVLTVVHQLSGTFNVIGPWRGDDRAEVGVRQDLERSVRQDVGSVFELPGSVAADAPPGAGGSGPGSAASTGSGSGAACDCSCNVVDSAPPACREACEGTYQACQGEPLAMLGEDYFAQQADLDVTEESYTADLRERFEAYLRERYGAQPQVEDVVSGYLDSFDEALDLNARVMLIGSSGMPVDCPAPAAVAERMKMAEFMYCQHLPSQQQ